MLAIQIKRFGVTFFENDCIGRRVTGSVEPTAESILTAGIVSETPDQRGPCLSEAKWIISRPEFEASARLKSLLLYIAQRSDSSPVAKVTQQDIAQDVMGLSQSFDPSCDAHVRIEVSRLRSALHGFYARLRMPRFRRLSIPKGSYRVQLEPVRSDPLVVAGSGEESDPKIAFGTLCTDDDISRRCGFEIECELLTMIANSAFVSDGLLSFHCVEGESLEALCTQAKRTGASVLLVTRVLAQEDRVEAYLSVIDPWDQRVVDNIRLSTCFGGSLSFHKISRVSESVGAQVIDPIDGGVLKRIFRLHPDSRIARLASVFLFMSNQDRRLLPKALAAADSVSQSSAVARALLVDMTRASYCFATDPDIHEVVSLADSADELVEASPNCIWANLALGYAGIANDRQDLMGRAVSSAEALNPLGAQMADLNLLRSLHAPVAETWQSEPETPVKEELSVFDLIRTGYTAVKDSKNDVAHNALSKARHTDVFWVQAFQISALTERGRQHEACEVFERMKKAHSGVQDYMHRAVSTMIPDADLGRRMSAELDRASQ